MKKVQVIIEKNDDGLWGRIPEYPSVFTYGKTMSEVESNAIIALQLYFEELPLEWNDIEIELLMDLEQFFKINDYINVTKLARRVGINTSLLRQYARGIKYPGVRQVAKIEAGLRDIGEELVKTQLLGRPVRI
ncbi:MAG: hypothetical protein DRQ89_13935 [Epsilonproteobacteria bacterium]|nr:MAG: hypothetical protein DRQ89_13935 [Campylobacterota bacterium]